MAEAAAPTAGAASSPARQRTLTLPEGELIILRIKPSLWMLVSGLVLPWVIGMVLWTGLLDGPIGMLERAGGTALPHLRVMGWSFPGFLSRIGLVLVLLCVVATAWRAADWWTRWYVLTDRRIVTQVGVLRQFTIDAPLRKIQHVSLHRGIESRLLSTGTLVFATAGTGGEFSWRQISRPHQRLATVREAIDRYGRNGGEL